MDISIIWDLDDEPTGNVRHIAEHGISREEAEEVIKANHAKSIFSKTSGNPITFGWTSTGRHIAVVWEHVLDDPLTIYPLTAYETPPAKE